MAKLINEVGNTYGYLTVIDRAENDSEGRAKWLCQCKCGNQIVVRGKSLRNGNTKSCGCYQKERAAQSNMERVENIIGKRFGKLVVIEEAGFVTRPNGKRNRLYNCQCDCGNICQVQHQYLTFGDTISCGCIRSKGEFEIRNILENKNIKFKQEYSFEDLKDKDCLRFDFALLNENNELLALIEFQGEQHFNKSNGFYKEIIVEHDKMKVEYCKNKDIKLYHIIYSDNIEKRLEEILNEL